MVKSPRENRIPIMMSDEELKAIDDWRFENRVATRSDAVRRLCQIGMEADGRLIPLLDSMLESSTSLMALSPDAQRNEGIREAITLMFKHMAQVGQLRSSVLSMKSGETLESALEALERAKKAWLEENPDAAAQMTSIIIDGLD